MIVVQIGHNHLGSHTVLHKSVIVNEYSGHIFLKRLTYV